MFERFTEPARRIVVVAGGEARKLHHNYIGSEHLLLAFLEVDDPAGAILKETGIDRDQIVGLLKIGTSSPSGTISFTPHVKTILELTLREMLQLGHNHIAPGHILLALLRRNDCRGCEILRELNVDTIKLRREVSESLTRSEHPLTAERNDQIRKALALKVGIAFVVSEEEAACRDYIEWFDSNGEKFGEDHVTRRIYRLVKASLPPAD